MFSVPDAFLNSSICPCSCNPRGTHFDCPLLWTIRRGYAGSQIRWIRHHWLLLLPYSSGNPATQVHCLFCSAVEFCTKKFTGIHPLPGSARRNFLNIPKSFDQMTKTGNVHPGLTETITQRSETNSASKTPESACFQFFFNFVITSAYKFSSFIIFAAWINPARDDDRPGDLPKDA